jgi:transcriptional regulator with XRE-family HTH domain
MGGIKMKIGRYIINCCTQRGIKKTSELANKMGTTNSRINEQIRRNHFTVSQLEEIAEALDAHLSIQFIDRTTGEEIIDGARLLN